MPLRQLMNPMRMMQTHILRLMYSQKRWNLSLQPRREVTESLKFSSFSAIPSSHSSMLWQKSRQLLLPVML